MNRALAFVGAALFLVGCSETQPDVSEQVAEAEAKPGPACCEAIEPAGELPDLSVYQLESVWRSQEDKPIKLSHFRGRTVIVAMMFTTCEYACPRTLADLKAIEAKLSEADRKRVRFVLVSFDTAKDKPAVLRDYATTNGLDLSRWTLLNGSGDDVRELAAVLGIKYKRSKAVGFSHSNLITVLDFDGRVSHQQKGIGASPMSTIEAVSKHE